MNANHVMRMALSHVRYDCIKYVKILTKMVIILTNGINRSIVYIRLFNIMHHFTKNLFILPPGGRDADKQGSCAKRACV